MTNLPLHGIDVPSNVRHDNTLARPPGDWGPKERVDVIVTNPSFGSMEEDTVPNPTSKKSLLRASWALEDRWVPSS